ncbi:MAG: D-alanine aminotransferase [Alphaproteobacteria bacterium MarineAlpha5_Bin9]|nr:MAG: D-alanine aminotransferase [Alphaproteobacteria bacterium MarineAlpha5_Bin9]|tara:strand:+ start:1481 stop:2323 length:843 start_codon:yes stop_codon:yes gene_type:complete
MSNIVFLNSKYIKFRDAKIHIEDRGLQFSDSVYEVVSFYNNRLIDLKFHLIRLRYSLNELKFDYKVNDKKLNHIFNKLIFLNKIKNGIIYLQITRGIQSRDHAYKKNLKPNIIVYIIKKKFNLPNSKFKGKSVITYPDLRWKRRDIKTVSLLANVIAKKEAEKKNAFEAILVDNKYITEATASNIWIIKKNILITHPSNTDILKGITRERIKILIKENNLILKEKRFTIKQLYNADEVFLTSSSSFVTPIIKVDSNKINNGKIGKISIKLAKLYTEKLND